MNTTKDLYLQQLGQNIKQLRIKHGWSQEELADKCGYTSDTKKSTISKIESGKSDLPISKLRVFANIFGVSCSDLCENSDEKRIYNNCEIFEQCHGKEAYQMVQDFLKLDYDDRIRAHERILTMLDTEKYSGKKERASDA